MAKASTPATPATPVPATPSATSDAARAVIADLRGQLAKLEGRRDAIQAQREEHAGKALIDKDAEAKAALAKLGDEALAVGIQILDMTAAIKAAEMRLREAEAREAAAHEFAKAKLIREIIFERKKVAALAEEALAAFNTAYAGVIHLGNQLRQLTDKATSMAHESMILRAAMQSSRCELVKKGLISSEPMVDERLRRPLSELIAHLDLGAQGWTDRIIADGASEAPKEQAA